MSSTLTQPQIGIIILMVVEIITLFLWVVAKKPLDRISWGILHIVILVNFVVLAIYDANVDKEIGFLILSFIFWVFSLTVIFTFKREGEIEVFLKIVCSIFVFVSFMLLWICNIAYLKSTDSSTTTKTN
jgi:hypothetical protein